MKEKTAILPFLPIDKSVFWLENGLSHVHFINCHQLNSDHNPGLQALIPWNSKTDAIRQTTLSKPIILEDFLFGAGTLLNLT